MEALEIPSENTVLLSYLSLTKYHITNSYRLCNKGLGHGNESRQITQLFRQVLLIPAVRDVS